jgi:hypothetical protein
VLKEDYEQKEELLEARLRELSQLESEEHYLAGLKAGREDIGFKTDKKEFEKARLLAQRHELEEKLVQARRDNLKGHLAELHEASDALALEIDAAQMENERVRDAEAAVRHSIEDMETEYKELLGTFKAKVNQQRKELDQAKHEHADQADKAESLGKESARLEKLISELQEKVSSKKAE